MNTSGANEMQDQLIIKDFGIEEITTANIALMEKQQKLTQKRARELFEYNSETGVLSWKKSTNSRARAGDEAGSINDGGYRCLGLNGKRYFVHRIIWLYVHGYLPEHEIDHINRDPSDNRIANLREVSRSCNIRNVGNLKNNTSGVKGVNWNKPCQKWEAKICVNNKMLYLGLYKDFDNAVCARLAAEQCLNWSGCDSNSTAFKYVKQNILGDI